jgi:ketol-acid reductoisomerase
MDFKGISHMVDNCSHTARLGSRRWAPRYDYLLEQNAEPLLHGEPNAAMVEAFKSNPIHGILSKCQEYRPSVDIALA